jgi:hypothetical protein
LYLKGIEILKLRKLAKPRNEMHHQIRVTELKSG